jgi:Zn-dependent protease with chaperone function
MSKRALAARAFICVGLLVGFYVLVAVLVVGVVALNIALLAAGVFAPFLLVGSGILVLVIIASVALVSFVPAPTPQGLELDRTEAADLWTMVGDLAERAGTATPDRMLLIDDANAFVFEDTRLLGLVSRERALFIGWPLLAALTTDEFAGIVGHEIGHFAHADSKLVAVISRAHETITTTIGFMREAPSILGRLATVILVGYMYVFLWASRSISRAQESRADELAVSVAGTEAVRSALTALPRIVETTAECREGVVVPRWSAGRTPRGVRKLFARCYEVVPATTIAPQEVTRRWYATHPSLTERLKALDDLPQVPSEDNRLPASELVRSLDACVDQCVARVGERKTGRTLESIEIDLVATEILGPATEVVANRIMRKANSVRLCKSSVDSALAIFVERRGEKLIPYSSLSCVSRLMSKSDARCVNWPYPCSRPHSSSAAARNGLSDRVPASASRRSTAASSSTSISWQTTSPTRIRRSSQRSQTWAFTSRLNPKRPDNGAVRRKHR